jgi:hypothetical protein
MDVASVRKPEFTSREDSAQDFAVKTRDLASGLGAGTLRNGLEPSLQIGLIGFNADSGDPSEVHSAERDNVGDREVSARNEWAVRQNLIVKQEKDGCERSVRGESPRFLQSPEMFRE